MLSMHIDIKYKGCKSDKREWQRGRSQNPTAPSSFSCVSNPDMTRSSSAQSVECSGRLTLCELYLQYRPDLYCTVLQTTRSTRPAPSRTPGRRGLSRTAVTRYQPHSYTPGL